MTQQTEWTFAHATLLVIDLLQTCYWEAGVMDFGKTCYGKVASLLRTCYTLLCAAPL